MSSTERTATIYIVRHGETIGNDVKILLRPDFDILNGIGKQQAAFLGTALKDVGFNKVYVSEYPRTRQTAEIILDANALPLPRSEIREDPGLQEIILEQTYGKTYAYLLGGLVKFLKSGKPMDEFSIDNSETVPHLRKRALETIKRIFQEAFASSEPQHQTILVVSHGACIRFLMEELYKAEEFEINGWDPSGLNIMRNTSQMKLLVKEMNGKIKIDFQKFHDNSHIPKEMLEADSLTRIANTPEGKCLSGCFQV